MNTKTFSSAFYTALNDEKKKEPRSTIAPARESFSDAFYSALEQPRTPLMQLATETVQQRYTGTQAKNPSVKSDSAPRFRTGFVNAFTPDPGLYLTKAGRELADQMQAQKDTEIADYATASRTYKEENKELNEQRRKTDNAYFRAALATPTAAASGAPMSVFDEYNERLAEAKAEDEKLRAMGGRATGEILPGAVEQSGAGYVNAAGTLLDFAARYGYFSNEDDWMNKTPELGVVTKLHQTADDLQQSASERIAGARMGRSALGQTLVDAGVSGIQMAGDAAINAIAPGAGLTAMGVRAFGNAAQDARQRGADVARQFGYGAAVAGVEVLSEKMFDGLAGIYGKGATDEIVEKVIKKLATSETGQRALKWLISAGGEMAEEWFAGAIDPALESIIDNKGIFAHYDENTVADILHDGFVGFLLGGLGGTVEAATYKPGQATANAETEQMRTLNDTIRNAYLIMGNKGAYSEEGRAAAKRAQEASRQLGELMRGQYGSMQTALQTAEEYDEDTGYTFRKMGDDAVRAIIAEGMESADGTESRTLAEQYQKRLDAGETLADAEIGKLYQANQDEIRGEARDNGQTVREYSTEPVNDRLMRLAQEVSQKQTAQPMTQRQTLDMVLGENANMGETGKKYARELFRLTQGENGNALDFYRAFDAVYQAARRGETAADVMIQYGDALTPQAAQAAFNAGVEDMAATMPQTAPQQAGERYTYTVEQNDGGRYAVTVRDAQNGSEYSGGVYDTQAEAKQAVNDFKTQMEGVTVNVESGTENADGGARVPGREGRGGVRGRAEAAAEWRAARQRAAENIRNSVSAAEDGEEVSNREAGISGGTDEKSMRIVRKYENDETRAIKAEAAKKGVNVVFFLGEIRAMKGGKKIAARGEYSADGKTFYIALDDPDFTARQIYDHEDFHERSHSDAELQEAAARIIESHSAAELREMVQAYVNAYGWTDMSNEDIIQEILADAYAGIDIFLHRDYYEGATKFTEAVRGVVQQREGEQQQTRGPPTEAKQSEIMEDADNERYNKENDAGRVRSGLVENHALDAGHSERARSKGDPGRSVRGASQKGSGRAVRYENLTQSEKDFAHTLLFDPLDASERYRDFYRDYSVTDLDEYLYTAFSENTPEFQALCRLIPEFKNGADTLLAYLNGEEAEEGYIQRTDNTGLTLSDAQYEYFKDSKVKDAQGHLKVMYRGGNTDIEVFDRKKSSPSNLYGRGFYFTDSLEHSKQFGNPRAYYLNVVTPLMPGQNEITRAQMHKFLKAVEADEDYGLENYGYGATVDSVLNSIFGKGDFEMIQDVNATAIGDLVAAAELFNKVNGTKYDGIIVPTETVTFSSEQSKKISNMTPTSNPNVNFSQKLPSETVLQRQNEALRDRVEYWKGQTKRTTVPTARAEDAVKAARQIVKDYDSTADAKEIGAALKDHRA